MGNFTEADIKTKYILPAIKNAGWDLQTQVVREEVSFTHGRIIVRGKMAARGTSKRADYILYYKPNIPLAIIEAKDDNHQLGDGIQNIPGPKNDSFDRNGQPMLNWWPFLFY